MSDLCQRLGFTGNALNTCRNLEENVLTPAGIYSLIQSILNRSPQFLTGIPEIIKDRIVRIASATIISQQLPWFIGFIIILVVLAVTKIISPLLAVLLGVLLIVIVFIVNSIMLNSIRRNVDTMILDVRNQIGRNWETNRNTIL